MDKIKEEIKIEEKIPKRTFVKRLTMGVLEDADIPLDGLDGLDFKSTKDFGLARKLLNAMILKGPPFTRDSDPAELFECMDQLDSFLEKSRRYEAAKEKLKSKRSPRH